MLTIAAVQQWLTDMVTTTPTNAVPCSDRLSSVSICKMENLGLKYIHLILESTASILFHCNCHEDILVLNLRWNVYKIFFCCFKWSTSEINTMKMKKNNNQDSFNASTSVPFTYPYLL